LCGESDRRNKENKFNVVAFAETSQKHPEGKVAFLSAMEVVQ
jgi:hypothetical protein